MRQFNKFKDTKGFITIWQRVIRFRYMITEQAKERCRILAFWEKHGTEATKEAFEISRRTLFRWQKKLKEKKGQLEGLNALSQAPNKRRKRKGGDGSKNSRSGGDEKIRTRNQEIGVKNIFIGIWF